MWIYSWGETPAWAIKIGLIVIGAVLFFMGGSKTEESNDVNNQSDDSPSDNIDSE